MELVTALKQAMVKAHVRKADVARACKITPQAVGQWFVKGTISREHLMTAARMCGTSVDELMGNPGPLRPPPLDLETLKKAVAVVRDVLEKEGKSKDVSSDAVAEMVALSYEKLVMAKQAELAVEQKISEMISSAKSVPPTSK